MKKIVFLSIISIFLISGCSGTSAMETMNCEYQSTSGNVITRINYDIDHQEDNIKKARITYEYNTIMPDSAVDGVGTGTDGTTSDTQIDEDGIIDGIVGETLEDIIKDMSNMILDVAGIKDRHNYIQNNYGNIPGFNVGTTEDGDSNYKVTYVIDYDAISDTDLTSFGLSRDLNSLRNNYVNQGYTCK